MQQLINQVLDELHIFISELRFTIHIPNPNHNSAKANVVLYCTLYTCKTQSISTMEFICAS
jgi:hypothetical protein